MSYQVQVQMGDVSGAGTDATVYIDFHGDSGESAHHPLDNATTNDFEAGNQYTFDLDVQSVGDMYYIALHHEGGAGSSDMYVDWVKVTDNSLGQSWQMFYSGWILDGETVSMGVPGRDTAYQVQVHTGDVNKAGTNADIHLTLYGATGDGGRRQLGNSDNNFEQNQTDTFGFGTMPDLNDLTKIYIESDNSGSAAGWYLSWVKVTDQNTGAWWQFDCDRWLDTDSGDALAYTLTPTDKG